MMYVVQSLLDILKGVDLEVEGRLKFQINYLPSNFREY